MGLHHPVAGRRVDWFLQSQEQGVAHHVGGVRGVVDPDDIARGFSAGVRVGTGERDSGVVAAGVHGAVGQDEKIHAVRFDFGGDGGSAGVVEFKVSLTSRRYCAWKRLPQGGFTRKVSGLWSHP